MDPALVGVRTGVDHRAVLAGQQVLHHRGGSGLAGNFLTGYQTLAATPLTAAECDRYYAEAACVAERLGATSIPGSRAEVAAYLARIRPELRVTPPALEVLRLLRGFGRGRRERVAVRVLTNAAIDLLPDWARVELAVHRPWLVRALWDRPVARTGGRIMVRACGPSKIRAAAYARATATATTVARPQEIG
ncbi:oxygenase MpaB family protein [Kitasatospora sp. NPDC001159]